MQEIKAIRINTPNKWLSFKSDSKNLLINEDGLTIEKEWIYKSKEKIPFEEKDIKDIALDECENIYLIDGKTKIIYKYDRYFSHIEKIVSCDEKLPIEISSPSGIAIDRDTIYITDSPKKDSSSVIAFSRFSLQIKWILHLKDIKSIRDIAIGSDKVIYVLTEKNVIGLNRGGEKVRTLQPDDLNAMKDPSDIAISKEGGIYILDRKLEVENTHSWLIIHSFETSGNYKKIRVLTPFKYNEFTPSGLSVSNDGNLFIGEKEGEYNTIYKVEKKKTFIPYTCIQKPILQNRFYSAVTLLARLRG